MSSNDLEIDIRRINMAPLGISAKECTFLLLFTILMIPRTSAEGECECQFDDKNCSRVIEDGSIFYSTAKIFYSNSIPCMPDNNHDCTEPSGIVKCRKTNFKPKYVEIKKCNYGDTFRTVDDIYVPREVIVENCVEVKCIFTFSICVLGNGDWTGNYNASDVLSLVGRILRFPEEVQVISVSDIHVNFDNDILLRLIKLQYVSLKSLQLKQIPVKFLEIITNGLLEANFSHNEIQEIRAKSFTNQRKLLILNLNYNFIENLGICTLNETDNFLVNLASLEHLYVSNNRISNICPKFFQFSVKITIIDLSYNKIVTLDGIFDNVKSVMWRIDLSHNLLEYISDKDFLFFRHIQFLDLSYNHIKFIDKFTFAFNYLIISNLVIDENLLNSSDFLIPLSMYQRFISLRNNNLQNFPILTSMFIFLFELDLSGNHISYLAINNMVFKNIMSNVSLNLENNNIKTVDFQMSNDEKERSNFVLKLSNNPLTCDCSVKSFHKFITSSDMSLRNEILFSIDDLHCYQPESLRDSLLVNVDEKFLYCDDGYQCPSNCTCQFSQTETRVNCDYNEFKEVPVDVPENTTFLSMTFNPLVSFQNLHLWKLLQSLTLDYCIKLGNITESDSAELRQLKSLTTLSLQYNNLTTLPDKIFDGLKRLSTLKLGHNLLTNLPNGILSSLTHLTHFYVNNNQMETISDAIFKNNEELQVINVCCNKLSAVKLNISRLHQLSYVDFSDNNLEDIEIQWPNNVKEILLHGNRIQTFNLINVPEYLHLLDLSRNRLKYLNMALLEQFVHRNAMFDFSHNLITTILEIELMENSGNSESVIILNNNPMHCDCRLKSFLDYLQLQNDVTKMYVFEMDNLFCNSPESMKDKRVDDIDVSNLPCEQDQCATDCKCYQQLSYAYRIVECDKFPSSNFVDALNELYVQDGSTGSLLELVSPEYDSLNAITIQKLRDTSVTSAIFSRMTNLTAVTIINNKNLQFSSEVFSNLSALVNLDIHSNGITDISSTSFQGDYKMQILNLSYNSLSTLPKTIFFDQINVLIIDLSSNALTDLESNLFENLRSVKSIILNHNSLKNLEKNVFLNCTLLEELDLSNNLITSSDVQYLVIPPLTFQICLARNYITHVENSWSNLRHLKTVDLSFNSISVINVAELSKFPKYTNFKLQDNNISKVIWFDDDYDEKMGFFNLNLENNPFVCDCNLLHFIQFFTHVYDRTVIIDDMDKLTCAQPFELRGRPLLSVGSNNLYCNLENCSTGCLCRRYSNGDINIVECDVTNETDLQICPDVVNELHLRGNLSVTFLQNDCWKFLKKLYVTQNSFVANVSIDLLHNHDQLVELGLTENRIRHVPSELFKFTSNLEIIDFSKNLLSSLSLHIFVKLFNLREIVLSFNQFKIIDWQIPLCVQSLNLAGNRIENIAIPKLNDHYRLKNFNLSYNALNMVPNKPDFLFHLKNLQILDLSHNAIAIHCNESFAFFPTSLQLLNISYNFLNCTKLWSDHEKPSSRLRHVDLSHNLIESLQINDFLFSNNSELVLLMQNCSIKNYSLNVSHSKNETWNLISSIDISTNNLIECNCDIRHYNRFKKIQNSSLTIYLQLITNNQCNFNHFNINYNLISKFDFVSNTTCCSVNENCPTQCSCLKSNVAVRMYCIGKGLMSLPSICPFNVEYLNMDYNNLTDLKELSHSCWKRLTTVSLRNNNIHSIANEDLLSLQFLQFVFLDGNELFSPSGWLEYFVSENILPFNITLSDNPWSCSCDNELFKKWMTNFSTKQMILDVDNIFCSDGSLFINFEMCPVEIIKILLPVLALFIMIIIVLTLTIFYYRKKMLVHAWCYGRNICGCCVNEAEIDEDKAYDAFLSYCEQDEQYVIRELLPGLEEREPFYKVCVHQRDWIAGFPIVEQIENSVKNSRRTIIVLSRNFANSTWANVEFRIANLQSIEDKINRVIAVTLDENFLTDELDPEFRAYLTMITYLKADDPQFWNKLRYVMPRKAPVRKNGRQRRASDISLVEIEVNV